MTVTIGITGPIGCGKSTVAGWLGEHGARVIDADGVAREVTAPGQPALAEVVDRFGEGVRQPDGSLDRAGLGRIVFSDAMALADLEAIIHPAVRRRIDETVRQAEAAGADAIVIEAIKLVEGGLGARCDAIWLVTCEPGVQRARLAARGVDQDEAERRIAAQGDIAERLAPAATRVIDTSGTLADVRRAVEEAWAALGA